jgi:RND family efflux transporter MFP subunit
MKFERKAFARWVGTLVLVAISVLLLTWLWQRYETDPWTRDGRVRAEIVRITPDVTGLVTSVAVVDNQLVEKGDLLFVLDRPRYELALRKAQASVASAQAMLGQARREASRDIALGDLVAKETHEQNLARVQTAEAAVAEAVSQMNEAKLNLQRTNVRASVRGYITNLDLHAGDYLAAGHQAMALLDADSLRVEGYFEETKLLQIHVGDKVMVKLMGDDAELTGRVDSISAGINDATRSDSVNKLPNVNPTFAWVRLAQRIPVRVKLDKLPTDVRLIAGRTATVTILPRDEVKPEAPAKAVAKKSALS